MFSALIAISLLGQYRACNTQHSTAYITPSATAYATYGQVATVYQTMYTPIVTARLVAIEPSYAAIVATDLRAEKNVADASAGLDARLSRIEGYLSRLGGQSNQSRGDPGPNVPPPPAPVPTPNLNPYPAGDAVPSAPIPPMPASPATPPLSKISTDAIALMKSRCSSCHTLGSAKGDLALFDTSGNFVVPDVSIKLLIDQKVYSGAMPPKKALDSSEYSLIRAWIGEANAEITAALRNPRK